MSPILDIQMRMRELGRIRLGDKGAKGQPQKLDAFRLTSANRASLQVAAALWGGEVRPWEGSPTEGAWELYTQTGVLPIALPPDTEPVSQWYEQWTAGGCTHRCDGARNTITDEPCSCDPDAEKGRACKATTRVNVMLPDLPDIGVWRVESHGWNAAVELPGTLAIIAAARRSGVTLEGRLRIDHRVTKHAGETRRFIVPVIDLDVTVAQLLAGDTRPAIGPGGANGGAPPQIPERAGAGEAPPPPPAPAAEAAAFADPDPGREDGDPGWGSAPPPRSGDAARKQETAGDARPITVNQRKRLYALATDANVTDDDVRRLIAAHRNDGSESTDDLRRDTYEGICNDLQVLVTSVGKGRDPDKPAHQAPPDGQTSMVGDAA